MTSIAFYNDNLALDHQSVCLFSQIRLYLIKYLLQLELWRILRVTIDAHFDYHDSINITETTIMILSRYYQVFSTSSLNMANSRKNEF